MLTQRTLPGGAVPRLLPLLLLLAAVLAAALPARAAQMHNVGFRTLGQWRVDVGTRLDINVWYPTTRQPRELNYAPWVFDAARNARPAEGRFPVIVLSHASVGTRFSYHLTAARLASWGFVVAAPTHPTDNMDRMDAPLSWSQLTSRTADIAFALDVLGTARELSAAADMDRVGVVGYGAGGLAALLAGGALPDCTERAAHCARNGPQDPYCNSWASPRIDELCAALPMKKSLADTRVKAIAVVSPSLSILLGAQSMRYCHPPVLMVAGAADTVDTLAEMKIVSLRFPGKIRRVDVENADVGAFMSPCPGAIDEDLPELCRSVTPWQRRTVLERTHVALLDFFVEHLGRMESVPHIPDPPDLSPPPAPEPAPAEKPSRRRRR